MLIGRFHRLSMATAALGLGLFCALPARGGIVFSDFGPGDTYNNTIGGYSIGGASGAFGQVDIQGATFTAGLTGTLSEIDVPFNNQGWPGLFNLGLYANDGTGKVGALLEWFQNVGPATTSSGIFSVSSSLHPLLTTGDAYWLIATPADPSTAVYWNENSIPTYGTMYTDINGSVAYLTGQLLPAFRVIAATSVPEPSSLLLLSVGGLALVGARSRRRRYWRPD
jgi:hypothetical protein